MSRQMSKWYPLEGYKYADLTADVRIEKMMDTIRKIRKTEELSETEKREHIRAIFEAVTEIAFEHEIRFDRVLDYVNWLYQTDEDAAAFDLALKLFNQLKGMVNPNRDALEAVCYRLEELADEIGIDDEDLMDEILLTRVHYDV